MSSYQCKPVIMPLLPTLSFATETDHDFLLEEMVDFMFGAGRTQVMLAYLILTESKEF